MNISNVKYSGFTDEASNNLDLQIKVTKELGWNFLSARTIGNKNIHEISERQFEEVVAKINEANIQVAEFGSLIGNWAKTIHSNWDITVQEIKRCIPRMQKLEVQYVRVMSYAQEPWGSNQYEKVRFKRLREIVARFADAGLEALHENCMNYGGFSADHTLRLIDEVPGLRLVFDTGNPIFQLDRSKSQPYPWQNSWEFYKKVKHAIAHVHIKDAIEPSNNERTIYTMPGKGNANLEKIIKDLLQSGYKGFFVIEPHIGKVFHSHEEQEDSETTYMLYLEYGRQFQKLMESIK